MTLLALFVCFGTALLAAFDEKTILPKYILDFELKVKQTNEKINKHMGSTTKPAKQVRNSR
jgi:hypothetical protein